MIATSYGGQTVYMLDDEPEWGGGLSAAVSLISQTDAGLSNREARRPYSSTLRLHTKFTLILEGSAARTMAAALRLLTLEPVLLPFWPAAGKWSDRGAAAISGGLMVAYKADWSQWALYGPGAEPGWPQAADQVVPVLWGRLESKAVEWVTPSRLQFSVDHVEQGPANYALEPAAQAFASGPALAGYASAPPVLPFAINFADNLKADFVVSILREQVGFTREPAQTFYPQAVARQVENQHFLETQSDAGSMLQWFLQNGGGQAFWCADWVQATCLAGDIAGGQTVLQVTDMSVAVGDYLRFSSSSGFASGLVSEVGVDGMGKPTITMATAPGAFAGGDTVVSHLLLAKFARPAVTLQWSSRDYATVLLPIQEVPPEYAPPVDETLGVTIGLLPTRIYLYEFSCMLAGSLMTVYFTSYESDVNYGGNIYVHARMGHGEITSGMAVDSNELEILSDIFAGNPMLALANLTQESPLFLAVLSADLVSGAASNVQSVFIGEVCGASVKGSRVTGKALPGGTIFDRQAPRMLFQLMCNYALFSPGCTLLPANYKFTAQDINPGAPGYPFQHTLGSLTALGVTPAYYTANWFAGGWVEFGAVPNWCRRAILLSGMPAAGVLTITLDRNPIPFPVAGAAVVLYPGCDGVNTTCQSKFDNWLNFGGHPLMPFANPAICKPAMPGGGGKK
jgi:hypothetical protein